ncbi:hypothetical protein [Aurantivibrio infirmus]
MKTVLRYSALFLLIFASCLQAADYKPPRMADGKPSLQGTWSNTSITRLQRGSEYSKLIIESENVDELTNAHPQVVRQNTDDGLNPEDGLLDGKDLGQGRGYNAFWIDPGKEFGLVKGTRRSSWIVEPSDGRIPRSNKRPPPRMGNRNEAAGPEVRSLGERCLIGFGGTGGPPMLNTLYNNTYQIVQTPNHVMILVEMVHDARIVTLVDPKDPMRHKYSGVQRWLGNSIGWWEGDTLVVETTNWRTEQAQTGPVMMSEKGKVTERFTRYSEQQIFYEFIVEDSEYYTQAWRGEMSLNTVSDSVYEYACHEGNIGMVGILQGARREEKN